MALTGDTRLVPADADYERVVRDSFSRQGFMLTLGARLAVVEPGSVTIAVPFAPSVAQQKGFFHGAVLGGIADSAGGYAALTLMPGGSEVVSVEYKINFLRPAVGEVLRARGQVVRAGRSVTVCQVEIEAISAGTASLAGVMQGTFMRVDV